MPSRNFSDSARRFTPAPHQCIVSGAAKHVQSSTGKDVDPGLLHSTFSDGTLGLLLLLQQQTLSSNPQPHGRQNAQVQVATSEWRCSWVCHATGDALVSLRRQLTFAALLNIVCKPLPVNFAIAEVINAARVQHAPNRDLSAEVADPTYTLSRIHRNAPLRHNVHQHCNRAARCRDLHANDDDIQAYQSSVRMLHQCSSEHSKPAGCETRRQTRDRSWQAPACHPG
jgi:hypothetical protein